jgi:MoxR-like ATPase
MTTAPIDVRPIAETFHSLRAAVGKVVVGQDEALRLCFSTLLCAGHSLIEGVPGVAKTLLVRTLAGAVDVRFGRVQRRPMAAGRRATVPWCDVLIRPLADGLPWSRRPRLRPGDLHVGADLVDRSARRCRGRAESDAP